MLRPKEAAAFDAEKCQLDRRKRELEELEKEGIRLIAFLDENYPKRLLKIHDYPVGLFVRGELPDEERPAAAVIGARNCTNYGKQEAEYMAAELAKAGVQIISGLAYGIDSAGHRGALKAGGKTFGVLGCGIKICYPRENYGLYERMCRQGGVLSEWMPWEQPQQKNFPIRNRIISGLADLVLVVEAKEKSGSLITAACALEQGKMVYAIPGAVNDALSRGCHKLIYDGAGIAYSPEILLDEWGLSVEKKDKFV